MSEKKKKLKDITEDNEVKTTTKLETFFCMHRVNIIDIRGHRENLQVQDLRYKYHW